MECALEVPMVVVVSTKEDLVFDASTLYTDLEKRLSPKDFAETDIQAMFNPRDGNASVLLTGKGLLSLRLPRGAIT
jgi:hypothetical protein